MKQCSKCGEQKPLDQFPRQSRNKDGRHSRCSVCRRAENLEHYHRTKHKRNPERNKKRRDTKYYRAHSLKTRYGITIEQYDQLVVKQNNRCAICQQPEQQTDPRYGTLLELAVDHDHNTGQIRGLLCSACNTAIGKFGDNPETLRAAITYLERQKPPAETGGQC